MTCGNVLTAADWLWQLIFNTQAIVRNVLTLNWKLMRFWKWIFSIEAPISSELRQKCAMKKVLAPLCDAILSKIEVLTFSLESKERGIWLLDQLLYMISNYLVWCSKTGKGRENMWRWLTDIKCQYSPIYSYTTITDFHEIAKLLIRNGHTHKPGVEPLILGKADAWFYLLSQLSKY